MDHSYKYLKYLKKNTTQFSSFTHQPQFGGTKKCILNNDDLFAFGHGGSNSIIVLTKDHRVFKFMPIQYFSDVSKQEKKHRIDEDKKNITNEIAITKLLSSSPFQFPHIIKLIDEYECSDSSKLFSFCSDNIIDFLKTKDKHPICISYFKNYPVQQYIPTYNIMELEYCPHACANYLNYIATTLNTTQLIEALDKLIFQIAYTLFSITLKYKYFSHNDLFVRNVLGTNIAYSTKYLRYKTPKHTFDVPATGFFPKIIDFGYTNLNENHHTRTLIESPYKDFFTFTYDMYYGENLGSYNLIETIQEQNSAKKLAFIHNYFSTFFDTTKLSKLPDTSFIAKNWDIASSKEFQEFAQLKTPAQILNDYFTKIFPSHKDHSILAEYSC